MAKKRKKVKKGTSEFYEAVVFHEKRPKRSRSADESRTSKNTYKNPNAKWFKNPAGSDIEGIDTKKYKLKDIITAVNFIKSVVPVELIKKTQDHRAIIQYNKGTVNSLQKIVNIRYRNVKISKRNKKGADQQFWVVLLKN